MGRKPLVLVLGFSLLGGCTSLTSQREKMLERGALRPSSNASLVSRHIGDNGVVCEFSDGTTVRRLNRAASCF